MGLAIVAVTAAQLLDLATFTRMVSVHGPRVEANPLVVFLLTDMGLPFVAVAKIAALSVIVAIIVVLAGRDGRERYPRVATTVASVATIAGIIGGLTNAIVIV